MPKIEEVLEGRFRSGNRNYTLKEIVYGPNKVVVWPVAHRFVVLSSPVVSYTGAYTAITADGSSARAFITARVQEYAGDTPIGTPYYHDMEIYELIGNVKDTYTINGQQVALDRFYVDSDGAVCGNNLMDHPVPNGYSISVRCGLAGQTYVVTVNQQANTATQTGTQKTYDGFIMSIDNDTFPSAGGNREAHISGTASFTTAPIYTWTSRATSVGDATPGTESVTPTSLYAAREPMSAPYPTFSGTTVTFPVNTLGVDITYRISGQATLDGTTYSSSVNVYVQETSYTYSDLSIQSYGYANIPAGGGTVYPGINFRINVWENGTTDLGYATGSVTDGAAIGYATTTGGVEVAVNVAYYVNSTLDGTNGRVTADSLGTTETTGTTAIKSGLNVTLSKGTLSASGTSQTVYQQRNKVESTQQGTLNITAFSATATPSQIDSAAQTTVVIQARATGSGTTTKKTYTSGATEGGGQINLNNDPVTPTSLKVDNVAQTPTTQFSASNAHSLNAKTYTVKVKYENSSELTLTVTQAADEKVPGTSSYHATLTRNLSSDDIWAGGGSVLLVAEAWHVSGLVWASDGQAVPNESETVQDINDVTLELTQTDSEMYSFTVEGFTATTKTFRLTHRDMKKIVGTDAVTVKAVNNGTKSTGVSVSVANARGNTAYESDGEIVWGATYPGARSYQVNFGGEIVQYSYPNTPAPFTGVTNVGYSAVGSHEAATLRDGTLPQYTDYRYTSWSAQHDDDDHRDRTTTYDTTTYAGQLAPGSQWTRVYTDPVTVEPHDTYSWLTINTTTQKISMAAQAEYGAYRYARIDFYNANNPATSGHTEVYQNAWGNLSVDVNSHNFRWQGGTYVFTVEARYTKFTVSHLGNWIGLGIRAHLTSDEYVYPSGEYGDSNSVKQYDLIVSATINDEDHNPTGYTQQRLAEVVLNALTSGISAVHIQVTQDEYQGGADQ